MRCARSLSVSHPFDTAILQRCPLSFGYCQMKKNANVWRAEETESVLVGFARTGDFDNLQNILKCMDMRGSAAALMHKVSHECTATIARNNAAFDSTRAEFLREMQQM